METNEDLVTPPFMIEPSPIMTHLIIYVKDFQLISPPHCSFFVDTHIPNFTSFVLVK